MKNWFVFSRVRVEVRLTKDILNKKNIYKILPRSRKGTRISQCLYLCPEGVLCGSSLGPHSKGKTSFVSRQAIFPQRHIAKHHNWIMINSVTGKSCKPQISNYHGKKNSPSCFGLTEIYTFFFFLIRANNNLTDKTKDHYSRNVLSPFRNVVLENLAF